MFAQIDEGDGVQQARLIPTTGIGSEKEAEQRATSALLAVLTIVRDLSTELLAPLGASRAQRAVVEAWTEVSFDLDGQSVRPDGLIRVSYGKSEWTALVEVKTGDALLSADQVNAYWRVATNQKFDHVITISNEIAPNAETHPTTGLKVKSNSRAAVSHLSWTAILTSAVKLKQHTGVADPEQAFILGELIRYLEHRASGAMAFSDMGAAWVGVRDAVKSASLTKKFDGVEDVAARWDQLVRYAALRLGSEIGEDVTQVLSKVHRESARRQKDVVGQLVSHGTLDGAMRIPNTVGDLEVHADVRAQRIAASVLVSAPQDKGAVGRVSWLVGQLKDARGDLIVETYPRNSKTCTTTTLAEILEERTAALDAEKREPFRFRIVWRSQMGAGRKAGGKSPGFIDSVLSLIDGFYGQVIQEITPWVAPTPKIRKPPQLDEEPRVRDEDDGGINLPNEWSPSTLDGE